MMIKRKGCRAYRRIGALLLAAALLLPMLLTPAFAFESGTRATGEYEGNRLYTVAFVAQAGDVTLLVAEYYAEAGAMLSELPMAPEQEGYGFLGWIDMTTGAIASAPLTVTGDMSFIASYGQAPDEVSGEVPEEILYPALVAEYSDDHMTVVVDAPEGALPEDVVPVLTTAALDDDQMTAIASVAGEGDVISAVDISFVSAHDNQKIQPLIPVTVTMTLRQAAQNGASVVHLRDDGAAELMASVPAAPVPAPTARNMASAKSLRRTQAKSAAPESESGETITFQATGFSVYAVVEGEHPDARMTVNFRDKNGDIITTVYIKNSDTLEEIEKILFDPGAGTIVEGETFRGWLIGDINGGVPEYTIDNAANDSLRTIEDIREWAEGLSAITEGDVVDIRAAVYGIYVITYMDEKGIAQNADSILVMPAAFESEDYQYEYTVNQSYTPPKDTLKFEGWLPTDETAGNIAKHYRMNETSGELEEISDRLYQQDDVIHITGNVEFRAEQSEGHWIVFHENGKGASYKAPQFVISETNAEDPGQMSRNGYTFGGWYTEVTGEMDDHGCYQVVESSRFEFGNPIDDIGESKLYLYAKWVPVEQAPYTVICWVQNADRTGYDIAVGGTYVGTGRVGRPIPFTVVANTDENYVTGIGNTGHFVGFNVQTDGTGSGARPKDESGAVVQVPTITPEGDAVLNLYYDRIEYNLRIYLYRQGSGSSSYQYAQNSNRGKNVWNIATWYGGTSLNNMPTTTYPGGIHSEVNDGYTGYYILLSAYYGEDISQKWPQYSQISAPANGRSPVSFIMMNGTGLKENGLNDNGYGTGKDTIKGLITTMDEMILGKTYDANGNYLIVRFNTYNNWRYHIWFETVDGEDYTGKTVRTYNGKSYYEEDVLEVRSSNTDVDQQNPPQYMGYEQIARRGDNNAHNAFSNNGDRWTTGNNPTLYHINYLYDRLSYEINYLDGTYYNGNNQPIQSHSSNLLHESDPIPHGALIPEADKNYVPELPAGEAGYVFEGWYLDEACRIPYTFTTMPVGGVTVHARWRQIQYRVFLKSNVPEDEEFTWGSDSQQMNFRISYGGTVSLPTGREREGYEFVGWYTTPNFAPGSLFTSDYALTEANVTEAYDKTVDMTDTMNKYGNIVDPASASNSDVGRDWITKKLTLYAKWRQVLVGADGINVVYDAGDLGVSSSVPLDSNLYSDAASATAQPAAASQNPGEYEFEYWIVQKWDEAAQAFVDTDVTVYPGDTFDVLKANAREEDYTDPDNPNVTKLYTVRLMAHYKPAENPTPTHIWWYNNFDELDFIEENTIPGHEGTVLNMAINQGVNIKPADTFTHPDGYAFIGWARVPGSVSGTENGGEAHIIDYETALSYLYLKYEDGEFKLADGSANDGRTVLLVAADEVTPYHDMYAVWEPFTQVPVEKIWQSGAFAANQPESVTVELKRNGASFSPVRMVTLSEDNEWEDIFTGLPTRDEDNHLINYSIVETVPEGWSAAYNPQTVKATPNGKPTKPLTVTNTPAYGGITLKKTIEGPTEEFDRSLFDDLVFKVWGPKEGNAYKNEYTFHLSDFTHTGTSLIGEYTLSPEMLAFVEPGEYIFYEGNADLLPAWGYTLDRTRPGTTGTTSPVKITLTAGQTVEGSITNAYTRDTGTLVVNKIVTGHPQGSFPYKVKIKNSEGWYLKQDLTLTGDASQAYEFEIPRTGETLNGTLTLEGVPTGTYTVEELETGAQIDNYDLEISYVPENATQTVIKGQTATVAVTNAYTRKLVPVTLQKLVNGNQGNVNDTFTFTVELFEDQGCTTALSGYSYPDQTRKHGQTEDILIGNFPAGAWVRLTEQGSQSYTTKAGLDNAPSVDGSTQDDKPFVFQVTQPEEGAQINVWFTNYANLVIPTGVRLDIAPYLALLGLALLGGAAWLVCRRRRRGGL